MKKVVLVFTLILVSIQGWTQDRYMIFFQDKTGNGYSIDNPAAFLTARAIARRTRDNIAITSEDLPVTESYVQNLSNLGAKVLYRTRWMNGVLVECTEEIKNQIAQQAFVRTVEYVAPGARPSAREMKTSRPGKFSEAVATAEASDVQLQMLGIDDLHQAGFHGEGVLIAILDAGFPGGATNPYLQHIIQEGRLHGSSYDFVSGSSNVFTKDSHGANVWSIMGAFQEGSFRGGAYGADFVLFITEYTPTEYRVEEYNWLFAAERADSLGVEVINSSVGYNQFDDPSMDYTYNDLDGETAVITRASAMAGKRGMTVVVSAGNFGDKLWQYVGVPADGKEVLSVGAVNSNGIRAALSSYGPTADQRIKPDVAAMGLGTSYVSSTGAVSSGSGTSYASPIVASLAAILRQVWPEISSVELIEKIRLMSSQAASPDNELGYGIPDASNIVTSAEPLQPVVAMISPNPFGASFVIELQTSPAERCTFLVRDIRGAETNGVQVRSLGENRFELSMRDHQPGLYLLQLQIGNRRSVYRIFKAE
jgi:serine protease AprX